MAARHFFSLLDRAAHDFRLQSQENLRIQDVIFERVGPTLRNNLYQLSPGPFSVISGDRSKARPYLSFAHIDAAQRFAHMSALLEEKYEAQGKRLSNGEFGLHTSLVINSIISCVCFMEAKINELFADAADEDAWLLPAEQENSPRKRKVKSPAVHELSDEVVSQMKLLWDFGVPRTARYKVIEKYEIALRVSERARFDTGVSPYQDVQALVDLRNYLVHAEPEWIITSSPDPKDLAAHKIEKKLRGKFEVGSLHSKKTFPNLYISSNCAKWAVKSSTLFVDDFCSKMGLARRYEENRRFPLGFRIEVIYDDALILKNREI